MLIDFRKLFPKYGIHPNGVLHIGANVGEEAPIYDELGIKNALFIEANPEIYPKLERNIEAIARRGRMYITVQACISDIEEDVNFHVSNNGSQSSSILELGTHKIAHPEVHYTHDIKMRTVRVDKLLHETDLDYDFLNIDVQGAELKVLRGMGDLLHRFRWAYLEVNRDELYKGCARVEDLDMYLLGFGFRRAETEWAGNTGWGDALYVKK